MSDLNSLLKEIRSQTQAITKQAEALEHLAASVFSLVELHAMNEEDREPDLYLDGTPKK